MALRILYIKLRDITFDNRALNQIRILREFSDRLHLLVFDAPEIENVDITRILPKPLNYLQKVRRAKNLFFENFGKGFDYFLIKDKISEFLKEIDFFPNLIFSSEIYSLSYAIDIRNHFKGTPKIVLELLEYYPEETNKLRFSMFLKKYYVHLLKTSIREVSATITVSNSLRELFKRNFGFKPYVIHNFPPYYDLKPSPVNRKKIRLVHHGGAQRERKLERLIELMKLLDEKYEIHFYLIGDSKEIEKLKAASGNLLDVRIFFHEPIYPPYFIPKVLNRFDIGVYLLEPHLTNYRVALPNKFFDFVQARLMNLSTPYSQDVAEIIEKYDLGIVTKTFEVEEAASKLNNLGIEDIVKFKKNADMASRKLCIESETQKLYKILYSVLE